MVQSWIIGSSVLILITLIVRLLFRKSISRRLQYALWLPVAVRLILPFGLWSTPVNYLPDRVFQPLTTYVEPAEIERNKDDQPEPEPLLRGTSSSAANTMPASQTSDTGRNAFQDSDAENDSLYGRIATVGQNLMKFLLTNYRAVWISGSALVLLWFAAVRLSLSVRLKRNRKLCHDLTAAAVCRIRIYTTDEVDTPCLFGISEPAVYLPEECKDEPSSLPYALEHEVCHYRQKDHIWSVLRILCLIIWWWNPLVWLAAAVSREDSELACDERVLLRLGWEKRFSYAEALLAAAAGNRSRRGRLFLTGVASGRREMKRRLMTMMRRTARHSLCASLAAVLMLSGTLLCFAGEKKANENGEQETVGAEVKETNTDETESEVETETDIEKDTWQKFISEDGTTLVFLEEETRKYRVIAEDGTDIEGTIQGNQKICERGGSVINCLYQETEETEAIVAAFSVIDTVSLEEYVAFLNNGEEVTVAKELAFQWDAVPDTLVFLSGEGFPIEIPEGTFFFSYDERGSDAAKKLHDSVSIYVPFTVDGKEIEVHYVYGFISGSLFYAEKAMQQVRTIVVQTNPKDIEVIYTNGVTERGIGGSGGGGVGWQTYGFGYGNNPWCYERVSGSILFKHDDDKVTVDIDLVGRSTELITEE